LLVACSGLRIGIALSFGSCPMQDDPVSGKTSYFGPTVAQTKALLRLVAGGQVLATRAFMDSVDTKEMTIVG
jgi:class 3 adenylate cyclase